MHIFEIDFVAQGKRRQISKLVLTNLNYDNFWFAFGNGTKILGLDIRDYSDLTFAELPIKRWDALLKHGFNCKLEPCHTGDNVILIWELVLQIILFTVKLGDPQFNYVILEPERTIQIDSGGLF